MPNNKRRRTKSARRTPTISSYPQKKAYEAMVCLVLEGPLHKRLTRAAQYLVHLTPEAFTGSDKKHLKAWEQIMEDLTWADADHRGEGKIDASIRRMLDEDARRVAMNILSLFLDLSGGWR
jgi:hypothetical protein